MAGISVNLQKFRRMNVAGAEDFVVAAKLLLKVQVVTNHDNPVAGLVKMPADLAVLQTLAMLIMNCSIAVNARLCAGVIEIRNRGHVF